METQCAPGNLKCYLELVIATFSTVVVISGKMWNALCNLHPVLWQEAYRFSCCYAPDQKVKSPLPDHGYWKVLGVTPERQHAISTKLWVTGPSDETWTNKSRSPPVMGSMPWQQVGKNCRPVGAQGCRSCDHNPPTATERVTVLQWYLAPWSLGPNSLNLLLLRSCCIFGTKTSSIIIAPEHNVLLPMW